MSARDRSRTRRAGERLGFPVAVLLVTALGAVIRWHNIGDQSLWLDELAQVTVARADGADFLSGVRSHTAAAPLDYLGTKAALAVLGFSTVAARAWSWLVAVMTIALVAGLTLEVTRDRLAALAAASLTALSGFLVFYAQEARFYSLAAATSVLAIWACARAARTGRPRDWLAFTVAAVVAVYTHYFAVLLLVLLGLGVLGRELRAVVRPASDTPRSAARRVVPLLLAGAVTGLAFLPWYAYAARHHLGIVYDYPPIGDLTAGRLLHTLAVLFAAVPRGAPDWAASRTDAALLGVVLGLAAVGAVRAVRARPAIGFSMLAFAALLIPVVWMADQRSRYFVSERQFIALVPIVHVFAGAGLAASADWAARVAGHRLGIGSRATGPIRIVVAAAAAALLVLASVAPLDRVYSGSFRPREDWRAASAYLRQVLCPGGRIFTNVGPGYAFGIALYAPELAARSVYLQERSQNEFLLDVLDRYEIRPQDAVVILRDRPGVYVAGRGTIETVTDRLAGHGFWYRSFTARIRLFTNDEGCPGERPSSAP